MLMFTVDIKGCSALLMHAVAAALHARDCALMYSSCTSSTVMNAMHVCIDALYCVFMYVCTEGCTAGQY
jgi:hypothetical protein